MFLIKELGFEVNLPNKTNLKNIIKNSIEINDKLFTVPTFFFKSDYVAISNAEIKEALIFNKNLLMENFMTPNRIRFPLSRNILEKYFN